MNNLIRKKMNNLIRKKKMNNLTPYAFEQNIRLS
jgi:hypothetical protein